MDVEIFGMLYEEAKEAYDEEAVVDLKSETDDDIESNCARIAAWIAAWKNSERTSTS
jgi:adenylate kinase